MARYREGVSVGSLHREVPLVGYVPPMNANVWRVMLREPEIGLSGGRPLGPLGFSDSYRTKMLRPTAMGSGAQIHDWMHGLGQLKEGPYAEQREFGIFEHGMHGLLKEGSYTLDLKDRGLLRPLSNTSNDLLSYVNQTRDMPSYPGLSRDRELKDYPSVSRERETYFSLLRDRASYSGASREQLPFQNPVRDLPPYVSLASILNSPDQRRDRSLDIESKYSRRLSPNDLLTDESSPYSILSRALNHIRTTRDMGGLPHSSLSAYRKSRSRSPLRNRELPSLSEVLGRCQSPPDRERSRFLPPKILSRHELLEDSSSRSVLSMKKDGGFGDKQMTGSVVRVDGIPAENITVYIAQLLDRLGEYGKLTDVQLHKESMSDYALFFYSDANAAYVALKDVEKNPLFSKSLKLSLWVMVADTDRPITLALTRVMYMENVEKTVNLETLHKVCGSVGKILDIELKETPGKFFNTAIVQYWDASNAQVAAQALNLEKIGKSIVKTISGKNTPSNCVWIDGLPKDLDKRELIKHFEEYGHVNKYVFDRQRGAALILYPARVPARQCVRYLENGKSTLGGQKIRADYANDRAQLAFCKAMEQSGQDIGNFLYA